MIGKRIGLSAVVCSAVIGLADPARAQVVISTAPTANMTCSAGVCSPTAPKAVLNVSDLAAMLASGDITIQSSADAEDIDFDATLSWTSAERLTLDAYRSIRFEKPIVVAGAGALTIATGNGGGSGDFRFTDKSHVEFRDTSSSLVINGHSYVLAGSMRHLIRLAHPKNPYLALARSVHADPNGYLSPPIRVLTGTFEGLGNAILGLRVTVPESDSVSGLIDTFGRQNGDTIRDLRLPSVEIASFNGGGYVGAVAGISSYGSIMKNVYVSGSVFAGDAINQVGGLTGASRGAILDSQADVTVTGGSTSRVGGLAGYMYGAEGADGSGVIQGSFSTGSVSGGEISAVGGLAGYAPGAVISDSYSLASVTTGGDNGTAGGLVGSTQDANEVSAIRNSYAAGHVSVGSTSILGGLIGEDVANASNSDDYWDLDTSGVSDPSEGAGNIANDPGLAGLTTTQLQSGLPMGFDASVWRENANVNSGYPYLIANPPR